MAKAMRAIKAVAFDLDGTLLDSAPDIAHALNAALRHAGLLQGGASFDGATVRGWVGDGPDALIARAMASLRAGGRAPAQADPAALRSAFDAATLAAPLSHGEVYAGIADALEELKPLCPLVVVTNKPRTLAGAVLAAGGLLRYFVAVHGADHLADRKPAPAMLLRAARELGLAPGELLMVGDGAADVEAARAARAQAVLVAWGYGRAASHSEALRIDRPQQLVGLVCRAMQGEPHAHGR